MLPGDYIVFKFSEKITTTVCGLSEGIFWDFKKNKISSALLKNFQIPISMIPEIVPSFGFQCNVSLNVKNGAPQHVIFSVVKSNCIALSC